ncbi:MAG: imidazole glycerol phosphate synthase subunit HisH [Candidatus Omnitrophica bacterium]|nr:imidazole glycerol phosphate synthase subunit HisH [Candidatus Omnitrophota bacterium]MDD5654136.1 imidazole glycerol phosphate synthase subunit HisH [Candidatus Omnitrophota bacterium]
MVAIIDYGMGNIHSVRKAIESCGGKVAIVDNAQGLESAKKVILPGVGAFDDAMEELNKRKLTSAILSAVKAGKPLLGICLGMQLLFTASEEGKQKGLGIFKGKVRLLKGKNIKIPHIGWDQINLRGKCPLLEGIADSSYVYFCHSYYPEPRDKAAVAASTDYGLDFASMVYQGNVFGAQFHPEKSQKVGLRILKNFVEMPCS